MAEPTMFERMLRGEVTTEQYVADVKRRVREQRRQYGRRGPVVAAKPPRRAKASNKPSPEGRGNP